MSVANRGEGVQSDGAGSDSGVEVSGLSTEHRAPRGLDRAAILAQLDLRKVSRFYTKMRGANGPCPLCGGRDRFYLHTDKRHWQCRQCHKRGDAISLIVECEGLANDFPRALRLAVDRFLGGVVPDHSYEPLLQRLEPPPWTDGRWQQKARSDMQQAILDLATERGLPGRSYLESRGIRRETWEAFELGYLPRLNAVALPWYSALDACQHGVPLTAIKARRIDAKANQDRFVCLHRGSEQELFGRQLLRESHDRLLAVEGEINCLSIWQALGGRASQCGVVSFGGDKNKQKPLAALKELAKRHEVRLWCDDPEIAEEYARAVGNQLVIVSPDGKDANDLLQLNPALIQEIVAKAFGDRPTIEVPSADTPPPTPQENAPTYEEARARANETEAAHPGRKVASIRLLKFREGQTLFDATYTFEKAPNHVPIIAASGNGPHR